ncbi:unnamed protein product, partial [Ixodes persulcatus]
GTSVGNTATALVSVCCFCKSAAVSMMNLTLTITSSWRLNRLICRSLMYSERTRFLHSGLTLLTSI